MARRGLKLLFGTLATAALLGAAAGAPWLPLWRRAFDRGPVGSGELAAKLAHDRFPNGAILTGSPDPRGVCHDWALAEVLHGEFVPSEQLDELLCGEGFVQIEEPQLGDLAVYRNPDGSIRHTGRVGAVGLRGLLLIESKWGSLGRYLHPALLEGFPVGPEYFRQTLAVPVEASAEPE